MAQNSFSQKFSRFNFAYDFQTLEINIVIVYCFRPNKPPIRKKLLNKNEIKLLKSIGGKILPQIADIRLLFATTNEHFLLFVSL